MPMNFPNAPAYDAPFEVGDKRWRYNGNSQWNMLHNGVRQKRVVEILSTPQDISIPEGTQFFRFFGNIGQNLPTAGVQFYLSLRFGDGFGNYLPTYVVNGMYHFTGTYAFGTSVNAAQGGIQIANVNDTTAKGMQFRGAFNIKSEGIKNQIAGFAHSRSYGSAPASNLDCDLIYGYSAVCDFPVRTVQVVASDATKTIMPWSYFVIETFGVPPPAPGSYMTKRWAHFTPETLGAGNSFVASWTDASGNARHATQASNPKKPQIADNSLNGYKSIYIYDIQGLTLPPMSALTRGSMFLVLRSLYDNTTDAEGFPLQPSSDATSLAGHYPYLDGNIYSSWGTTQRLTVGNPVTPLNGFHILSIHSANQDYRVYVNNVLIGGRYLNAVSFPAAPFIGNNAVDFAWSGFVCEVVIFNTEMTTAERSEEYRRLKTKFAL